MFVLVAIKFFDADGNECVENVLMYVDDMADVGNKLDQMYGDDIIAVSINIIGENSIIIDSKTAEDLLELC